MAATDPILVRDNRGAFGWSAENFPARFYPVVILLPRDGEGINNYVLLIMISKNMTLCLKFLLLHQLGDKSILLEFKKQI